jgi:hypothetical protein
LVTHRQRAAPSPSYGSPTGGRGGGRRAHAAVLELGPQPAEQLVRRHGLERDLMAGSVIATLPMVLVFMIFQRHFIKGISLSGLKG